MLHLPVWHMIYQSLTDLHEGGSQQLAPYFPFVWNFLESWIVYVDPEYVIKFWGCRVCFTCEMSTKLTSCRPISRTAAHLITYYMGASGLDLHVQNMVFLRTSDCWNFSGWKAVTRNAPYGIRPVGLTPKWLSGCPMLWKTNSGEAGVLSRNQLSTNHR